MASSIHVVFVRIMNVSADESELNLQDRADLFHNEYYVTGEKAGNAFHEKSDFYRSKEMRYKTNAQYLFLFLLN